MGQPQLSGALELVIFDMGGTTVEDRGQVPSAFAAALAAQGVGASDADIHAVRGASKREAIRALLAREHGTAAASEARVETAYAAFKSELEARFATGVNPVAGALDCFEWLWGRGERVALSTGFDRDIVNLLLRALHWDTLPFAAVVCGDDVAQGRPAPYLIFRAMERAGVTNVHRVANVGDTVLDLESGHNAGVRANVGVLSGAHRREQLAAHPHTHLLNSVSELPAALADWLPQQAPART